MIETFLVSLMCYVKVKTSANSLFSLGCGHCKKAKPEFMDAAKHDADNNKVSIFILICFILVVFVLGTLMSSWTLRLSGDDFNE